MARKRKPLRGTRITGDWSKGKKCEVTEFASMRDVRECARICSSHFFDKDSMRFFNSRIGDSAYGDGKGGAYFVTSEKGPSNVRSYSVRRYDPKRCGIETVGKFQQYGSAKTAQTAAKRAAGK
jgi:hypothetical protein